MATNHNHNTYSSPLSSRYCSKEMLQLFSDNKKYSTFRLLWLTLAKAQKELGLQISDEQIIELENNIHNIDYDYVAQKERELKHDVMAHIHAYGHVAPKGAPIIHLGATSAYVLDNTDIIIQREGLNIIKGHLATLMDRMAKFAQEHAATPTLGYTHFQSAQITTIGKRASLWLQDLMLDFHDLEYTLAKIQFRGAKGTIGTQASFMELFQNDSSKVKKLDTMVANKLGFDASIPLSGQTYTRKQDTNTINLLASIASSLHKMATDIRLLAHTKELEEPFGSNQVGSSAMAYKRNPIRCERVCSLSRLVLTQVMNAHMNHSLQWLERSLDDSANRRIYIAETFLLVDAVLNLSINIVEGLKVYPKVIESRINTELPFLITESVIMACVKKGGDRQIIHERIRQASMETVQGIKLHGESDTGKLINLLLSDPIINLSKEEMDSLLNPLLLTGRSEEQVHDFLSQHISPILEGNRGIIEDGSTNIAI